MIFSLDLPPSTNRMYRRAGNIIHKSDEYRNWLNASGWNFAEQVKDRKTLKGPVAVEIFIGPMHASRDTDSVIKPLGDFLQHAQIVANDWQIREWRVAGDCASIPRNTIMVTVRAMGEAA